jgi:hypothetical protein
MAMKKTSGGDSALRQGAGKSFWTLPIFGSTAAADRDVFWKSDWVLRFFLSGGLYRRRGDVRGRAGPYPRPARAWLGQTGTPPSDPDRTARGLLPRVISHVGEAAQEG